MKYIIVAVRGRILDKDVKQTRGNYTQVIEPNLGGVSNTLTSVAKDNLVLEISSNSKKSIQDEQNT